MNDFNPWLWIAYGLLYAIVAPLLAGVAVWCAFKVCGKDWRI